MKTFLRIHCLFFYFADQNTNSQREIFKALWPHASGISAMLSIVAFLLGN